MIRARLNPEPPPEILEKPVVGILLPLPLAGAYDYKLPAGLNMGRGALVAAPLGNREVLGVVWGAAEGTVGDNRLKVAEPLEGAPALPGKLCDFIDWVADYTLNPPGAILAMALRSRGAFEPEARRIAYVKGDVTPPRMSAARARALEMAGDGLARSVSGLAEDANVSAAVVRGLIQAGALVPTELPEFTPFRAPDADFAAPTLNPDQSEAAASLCSAVAAKTFSVHLLDGVTGSGKTEVYFEAIAAALAAGRQALILLPEIALTVQFLERFAQRFGTRPAEWHSDLSQKERRRVYRAVMRGEARSGGWRARSSLFLPVPRFVAVLVIDEERRTGVQTAGRRHSTIARRHGGGAGADRRARRVILASATPSLESFVNAQAGRYHHLKLASRHGVAEMPEVRLIDLRHARDPVDAEHKAQWLLPPLRAALKHWLRRASRRCCSSTVGAMHQLDFTMRSLRPQNSPGPHCSAWLGGAEHKIQEAPGLSINAAISCRCRRNARPATSRAP